MKNIFSKTYLLKFVLTFCISILLSFTWKANSQNVIQVNRQTDKQTIWGFGGAANHPVQDLKTKLSEEKQKIILDKLFRTDNDNAGLSIVRLEINPFRKTDPDPNNREQYTCEPSDGAWDWNTDQYQRWFAQEAINRSNGVHFMACPWSPPGWMKTNNSPVKGGSLKADFYDKFAGYLKTYVDHYRNIYGFDIRWVSIQNEPTNNTNYASCIYSNSAMNIVAAKVADSIHSLNQGVLVGAPEGATRGISVNYMNAMSASTKKNIDYILTHDYTGATNGLSGYDKLVINTEVWSEAGSDDITITDGLRWANAIQSALVGRNEPGWLYWWIIDPNGGAAGLISIKSDGTYTIPKRLYAMGQFSRFMREGDKRIDATSSNGNLAVTASKNALGVASIVVINNSGSSIISTINGLSASSIKVYRTSSTESLSNLPEISVASGSATVTFAAKSITTLVETSCNNAPPTIDNILEKSFFEGSGNQVIPLNGMSDGDGGTQGFSAEATSDNPNIASITNVSFTSNIPTGSVSVNPLTNGTANITVTITDGGTTQCPAVSKPVSFKVKVLAAPIPIPAKIEAENYFDSLGIQTETTTDVGGGKNVGWTDAGDWLKYYVNVASETTFKVDFRVASLNNTGKLELREGTTVLISLTLNPGTGGWQSWQTKPGTNSFTLPAGIHTLSIYFTGPGLNINWFNIIQDVTRVPTKIIVIPADSTVFVGNKIQYNAQVYDQFDEKMDAVFGWSVDGGGTIDQNGLFTATTVGNNFTVTASSGGKYGPANVSVKLVTSDPLLLSYFHFVDKWTADYMRPTDGLATAVITQYESAATPTMSSFQWEFKAAPTTGYYHIINKWTGNAIQPTGASIAENAGISQVALTTANQNNTELQWEVKLSDEANYYWIKNRKSGLTIRPNGGANGTGIPIVQNMLNTAYSSFKWKLNSQGLKSAFIGSDEIEITGKELAVYPNPVTTELQIQNADQNSTVEVFDLSGRLVLAKKLPTDNNILNVKDLNAGLYILKATGNDKTKLIKFIKK